MKIHFPTRRLLAGGIVAALVAINPSLTMTSHGRLGETLQECIERYGQPLAQVPAVNPPTPAMAGPEPDAVFSAGNFRVHCWFNSVGVCDRIAYWQVARATAAQPPASHLIRRELVHILEINQAHDQSWTPLEYFGLAQPQPDERASMEDYSWWRRTFAPQTVSPDPVAEEFSWWRRTFAPETIPGSVPPPAPPSGIRIPTPPPAPPAANPGPADGIPDHDLAWITTEGSRFAIYRANNGLFQIMTRDAARRQNLRQEADDSLLQL